MPVVVANEAGAAPRVRVELIAIAEDERGRGLDGIAANAGRDPREEPPRAGPRRHLEPEGVLARLVHEDRRHHADEDVTDPHGRPEADIRGAHDRESARWSCAFVIFERPRMLRSRASS